MSAMHDRPADVAPDIFASTIYAVCVKTVSVDDPENYEFTYSDELFTDFQEAGQEVIEACELAEEYDPTIAAQGYVIQVALDPDMPSRYGGKLLTYLLGRVDMENEAERAAFMTLARLVESFTPKSIDELPQDGRRLAGVIDLDLPTEKE